MYGFRVAGTDPDTGEKIHHLDLAEDLLPLGTKGRYREFPGGLYNGPPLALRSSRSCDSVSLSACTVHGGGASKVFNSDLQEPAKLSVVLPLAIGHPLVRRLDLRPRRHGVVPLFEVRVAGQGQLRHAVLEDPRIEVHVDGAEPLWQHARSATLCQLALEHAVGAVRLLDISLERVVVLGFVVMPKPVDLALHRTQATHEEEDPLVEVDAVLL